MNCLSHFYLDRKHPSVDFKLGTVLPDLIRTPLPGLKLFGLVRTERDHPENAASLRHGIRRHFEADKKFHDSGFFRKHCAGLKNKLTEHGMNREGIRMFFITHILAEILLDRQLLLEDPSTGDEFYSTLEEAGTDSILSLFQAEKKYDHLLYSTFHEKFRASRYLLSYREPEGVFYALNRICKNAGTKGFDPGDAVAFREVVLRTDAEMKKETEGLFVALAG